DLSMLGYDWIVDDHPRLKTFAEAKGFTHFKVAPFHYDRPRSTDFDRAIGDILELAKIRYLERAGGAEFHHLERERSSIRSVLGSKPVFVINRAPIKLDTSYGTKAQIVRSDGGAAPAIKGTLDAAGGGLVIAAANTRAEQALARQKKIMKVGDIWVLYLDIP